MALYEYLFTPAKKSGQDNLLIETQRNAMPDATTPGSTAATPQTVRGRRIAALQLQIAELQDAVHTVLTTGKSYTLSNSHAVTRADVADIQAELAALRAELAALFSGSSFHPLRLEPTKFF